MARILLVDDEAAVRDVLGSLLRQWGHACDEAIDGEDALRCLSERSYDVVVTDVSMPRMNGFQFLRRALPHVGERVPFVVLSSVEDREGVAAALGAGAIDYLHKPCRIDDVRQALDRALTEHARRQRLHGPWRGPGGPLPASALRVARQDPSEAPPDRALAGVPAFQPDEHVVCVGPARPAPVRGARRTLLDALRGLFGVRRGAA